MTQGMVCHETYRDAQGNWLYPEEVEKQGNGYTKRKSGEPVTLGRVEKMSKSRRNTVDPRHIIESYGADTARLFMLSDSPPDRDLEWTESGVEGAWRYINRLWRMVLEYKETASATHPLPEIESKKQEASAHDYAPPPLRRAIHQTIAGVTEDIENFHFNKAVARIRELTNSLANVSGADASSEDLATLGEGIETVIRLLAPILPHFAAEAWEQLGHEQWLINVPWPQADPDLLVEDTVTLAVQVNGKLRATLDLPRDMDKDKIESAALAEDNVKRFIAGKQVRKIIVVPGKIVNVVAA